MFFKFWKNHKTEKRAFQRIPAHLFVTFLNSSSSHNALVTDISENGVYFITEPYLPPGFNTILTLSVNDSKDIELPVKIIRTMKTGGIYDGFGAELSEQSGEYLEFVRSIRLNNNPDSN